MTGTPRNGPVLVTGASGFIAGHIVRELLEHGYAVRGTVRSLAATGKVAHLRAIAERTGGSLELVEADLAVDRGWAYAVAGCTYVLHVASPFPPDEPERAEELVRPAVEGTLRVLRACAASGTVRRVVLTSSIAAITSGHDRRDPTVRTERDWADPDRSTAYQQSKTLAERAAWRLVGELPPGERFELVVVNPGFVLGPVLRAEVTTSTQVVHRLLIRKVPASPRIGFAPVDVRDLATAHRLAMEAPRAAGNRYICAGEHVWMRDLAGVLAAEFNPRGYRVPTGRLPYWLMWTIARFDRSVRLALAFVGRQERVSAEKAARELGWSMRPVAESIVDTGWSLVEQRLAPPPVSGPPRPRPTGRSASFPAARPVGSR
jgi:nucleoside-diphosphate-sugar epimerase